jgi:hypothetical protein
MFCFFKGNEFVNFWSNSIGDIFADLTCHSMKWDKGQVDLVYYWGLDNMPEHYEFDSNKVLIVKNKVVTQEEVLDENGNPSIIENVSYTIHKQVDPDFFMSKGVMVKPC